MSDRDRHSIQQSIPYGLWPFWGMVLLLLIFAAGCTTLKPATAPTTIDLASAFPAANAIPGWEISQKVESYGQADLFNLVDGQADSFFAFGFEQVSAQRYRNSAGTLLNVEIWQLAAPADAYGLFSTERSGVIASIGNEGDSDPGRRLAFWQDRCFVSLEALQPMPDQTLQAFAQAIAGRLPKGGERPALVDQLPPSGLVGQSIIFFHEEISIQTEVWLGGENILGLSQATEGVLGQYQLADATIQLMLIEYPTSGQTTKGLKALQSGNVAGLVASDVRGNLLGAIFGKVTATQAQTLLQEALK